MAATSSSPIQNTQSTVVGNTPSTLASSPPQSHVLDLSNEPPIFVSSTHFLLDDLHELEEDLASAGAHITYDIDEAEIVLSKVKQKKRSQFDLRGKGLVTRDADEEARDTQAVGEKRKRDEAGSPEAHDHEAAAVVIDDSSTASDNEAGPRKKPEKAPKRSSRRSRVSTAHTTDTPPASATSGRIVKVVKIEWFTESRNRGRVLPLNDFLTYTGVCIEPQQGVGTPKKKKLALHPATKLTASSRDATPTTPTPVNSILQRAQEDAPQAGSRDRFGRRNYHHPHIVTPSANPSSWEAGHGTNAKYAHLLQETTTEHDEGLSSDIPEPPEWVKKGVKYACQRVTPRDSPNEAFLALLQEIKTARLLVNDEIGVRAYSTFIASLRAYPFKISHPRELLNLPGCEQKLANLWIEWKNSGTIKAVEELRADEDLKHLRLFYDIWGVGATTAREFYFEKGWRELDDIIEYGWKSLSRVQQIGVKFYDEFQDLIPRAEVEAICKVIRQHAVKVCDEGIKIMIVGGYRRGKEASGDVDVVVSHPDHEKTQNLVNKIVDSLEEAEYITHVLLVSENASKRGQETLPFRADGGGHGFDTLDKALVVWQDPDYPNKEQILAANPGAKNPNIHRRVDIILSPWKTVGCAVVGWSGGTTFERDLRRYAKNQMGWKFDSSGVRDRGNGQAVDIEGYVSWKGKEEPECRAKTMEEAERRVFEGFGLEWREPTERVTG
ncbi:DNA polymerase type-X family protein pol4 [Fulvia fulva]|nr:DNA polymerase type-X family protein pol4 [Fulvia fulva]WPV15258.1 DNA polymerase type-X family protein pol4 [Fulvia fulva]WPV29499.1 DNA polymerase type-X family protein pol4 [Fulvia fulva]